MGLSIQEQLLKAGLVDKKQAKKAEHDKRVKTKKKKKGIESSENSAKARLKQEQAERAERDKKLNAERNQESQRKADKAAALQLIKTNKSPLKDGDVGYHYFGADNKIKRIHVNQDTADNLAEGKIGLAMYNNDLVLISAETVIKVLKLDKEVILVYNDPTLEDEYPTDW